MRQSQICGMMDFVRTGADTLAAWPYGYAGHAAAKKRPDTRLRAYPGAFHLIIYRYFPDKSTAWRRMEYVGTGLGSCIRNVICGVLGSSIVFPSASSITGT